MSRQISVLLVDDHALLRREMRRNLEDDPEIAVLGEAGDGAEALELARLLRPEVVVMDVIMPRMDGIEATREILREYPGTAVLMLSIDSHGHFVRNALQAGARGYLIKGAEDLDLPAAVKDVFRGQQVLGVALHDS
jgi:DNA-binding NarL/FixJ family response regulator